MRAHLISALLRGLARLPLSWNRNLATATGWLLARIPNALRRHTEINLALCHPELTAAGRAELSRRSLIETCKTALEAAPLWMWPAERIRPLLGRATNAELVDAALAEGHGVIIATPHLGSWEMGGHFCGARWGITSLYRPPRIAALDALIRRGRERLGSHLVPTTAQGIRELYQVLSAGGIIAILPDQDPGQSGGCFAPFFGIPANSMILLGRLARKTGARVFFAYCERLDGASGYHTHFMPAPEGIDDADPVRATTAMNLGVEGCVRACPEQYQWSYRRFRTRPPGEDRIY